jgi:hypothetical protein
MLRSVATRFITSGVVMTGGLFAVGSAALFAAPTPAFAGVQCPTAAPVVCIIPASGVTNHEVVKVVVKTGVPNANVAITECNHNLAGGDTAACDSNAADFGKPGGPMIATANANGKVVFEYKVLVSATKALGDGNCSPGGDTCFIVAANPVSQAPYANPAFFTTA